MTLASYLKSMGLTQAAFAAQIGTSRQNVSRWCEGVIPRRADMLRLLAITEGKVTPNDFALAPIAKPQPERAA